tara:strand:+ start:464 stop:1432 length:969 start_codon:yes stop_codon:yes gene_type:complete
MVKKFKIGNIEIANPVFLAPMAGVTDRPFRLICKELGAGFMYTEFVSANGIIRENKKTLDMIRFTEIERPLGVQIFGDDPFILGESANMIASRFKPDLIDINFGCPVPKVANKGAGSGALKDLNLMEKMTKQVIDNSINIPVTVKMRAGWDKDCIVSTEAGPMLESLGVKAITLHPRTRSQSFGGKSDWSLIKDLKSNVKIPIIGNGDIKNSNDAINMFNETNCDAIMVARGVLGNPWLLKSINNKLLNKLDKEISYKERIKTCKKHFELLKEDKNEKVCINHTKKHFNWYLKGFSGASNIRKKFMQASTIFEIENILNSLL